LNAFGGAFLFTMVTGADRNRLGLLLAGAYALLAVTVFVVTSRRHRARSGGRPAPRERVLSRSS
jgi:hypothetical protein